MADKSQATLYCLVFSAADSGTIYQIPFQQVDSNALRYQVLGSPPPFIESSRKLLPYDLTSSSLLHLL